jgi:DNA-binding response OmpR family regulator
MDAKARILVVEDDPDAAEAMKVTLEAQGWTVDSAGDPEAGLGLARQNRPQVIILDVMFGPREQTKGFDYAAKIRQDKELASVPILMITAVNVRHPGFGFYPESDEEYLPVDDFIDKPAQPRELVEKVGRLLEQKTSKWKSWPAKDR